MDPLQTPPPPNFSQKAKFHISFIFEVFPSQDITLISNIATIYGFYPYIVVSLYLLTKETHFAFSASKLDVTQSR